MIVSVLNVDGKDTDESCLFIHVPSLQYYKNGMSNSGLVIDNQTRNSKGFLIIEGSNIIKKEEPEKCAQPPKVSNLNKDNSRQEQHQSDQNKQKKTGTAGN